MVEIWLTFGSVALIASLASSQGRRLGDYLGGTVVVHERVPVRASPMAAMPPQLAGWAAGLDLSRVPDDLALAARQFLARAHELSPPVRDEMGASLASALRPGHRAAPAARASRCGRSCRRCSPSGGAGSSPGWAPAPGRPPAPADVRRRRPPPTDGTPATPPAARHRTAAAARARRGRRTTGPSPRRPEPVT